MRGAPVWARAWGEDARARPSPPATLIRCAAMMPPDSLRRGYAAIRAATEGLCAPLRTEDYVVQTMPDASPAKWHLAHTSWFFERFLLRPGAPDYRPLDDRYDVLF